MNGQAALSLDDMLRIRGDMTADQLQILAHEQTAALDPYFNESNFITLGAATVPASFVSVVKFSIPHGNLGILRAVAMQTNDITVLNNVVWQVRFNGAPIHGLDNIVGPMSTFLFPLNVDIAMYDAYTVEVVARNLSATPIPGTWGMVRGNFFGRNDRVQQFLNQWQQTLGMRAA